MIATAAVIVLVGCSALGCWLGAPPDTRRQMVRELRRERAIRQWKREQRRESRR